MLKNLLLGIRGSKKTAYFLKCLIRKVQVQGLRFLKIMEFTFVNDCFQKVCNAEIGLFVLALITLLSVSLAHGQFVDEVLEYTPAPGQLINDQAWGTPSAAQSIIGGVSGHVTLGAFGGYIVFKFDQPVENHPDNPYGVDFTIFGNPLNDWAEPACVWVMNDENQNGEADDNWYLLAGSDYHFTNSIKNYQVTYTNPGAETAEDISWTDNLGNSGTIPANATHTQPYYPIADSFPHINEATYMLSGLLIQPEIDDTNPAMVKLRKRSFGFVDNQFRGTEPYSTPDNPYTEEVEHSGSDAFDISWAVDEDGNYIELDQIHFIKVQNSVMGLGGWLGEISTEITGAVDVEPDNTISGLTKCIAIKDIPATITTNEIQLEALLFDQGKPMEGVIDWTTNMADASIDDQAILHVESSGNIEITATLTGVPSVYKIITAVVDLETGVPVTNTENLKVYPNPSNGSIVIGNANKAQIDIFNQLGQHMIHLNNYFGGEIIQLSNCANGVYIINVRMNQETKRFEIIKQ